MIKTIGIIGTGNVSWHLSKALLDCNLSISWIYGRNQDALVEFEKTYNILCYNHLPSTPVDLILICVSDDAIQNIINQLPQNINIAYTSGSVSLHNLDFKHENCGVFYPLQTFTKNRTINISEIPFLIEANNEKFAIELQNLAKKISKNVQIIDSEKRKQIHIAAVFANNFVNHIIYLAQEHLKNKNLDPTLILPLLEETFNKIKTTSPYLAQSGPAKRNDKKTIDLHFSELTKDQKEIYKIITNSILKTYHENI